VTVRGDRLARLAARWLLILLPVVLAACNNSGGGSGY
jgi:predicted small secreted protein